MSDSYTEFLVAIYPNFQGWITETVTKGVLWKGVKNSAKFTGKHLCQSPLFNKVVGLRPATLLWKRLWHSCFPMNFAKFLRTFFLQNISERLLLELFSCIESRLVFSTSKTLITFVTFEKDRSKNSIICDVLFAVLSVFIIFFELIDFLFLKEI